MEILRTILCGLAVLLLTSEGLAQTVSTDEVYKRLDDFIAKPNPDRAYEFGDFLKSWSATTQEEQLAKVISFCNLGYFQREFFQFNEAIVSYETAKGLFQNNSLSNYDMLNACYIPLGNLYTRTNALGEAESTIKEYILLAKEIGNTQVQQAGFLNLSIVYKSKGSYTSAISVLKEGLKFEPSNRRMQLQLAQNYLKIDSVLPAKNLVDEILKQKSDQPFALQLRGELLWKQDARKEAILALERVKTLQERMNFGKRDRAKTILLLTEMYFEEGRLQQARSGIKEVYGALIPGFSESQEQLKDAQLFPENTLIEALEQQARLLEKETRPIEALLAYQQAFKVYELLQAGNQLQESKILWQTRNKERSERCLSLLYNLYEQDNDTLWLQEALHIDQQSKAPVLNEARREWEQLSTIDTSLAKKIRTVQNDLAKAATQIKEAVNSGRVDERAMTQLQSKYSTLVLEQRMLYEQVATLDQGTHLSHTLGDYLRMAATRAETWVSYFIGKEQLFQFIISDRGIEFNRLASSKKKVKVILQYINEYNNFFRNSGEIGNNPNQFAEAAHELYKSLALPKATKLLIIPDGTLSFVSFQALLTEASDAILFSNMPFLIKESELSYAISLDDFMATSEESDGKSVLGIFPVFNGTNRELPYSVAEAETLQKTMKATIFQNEEATAAQFLKSAANYDILHISTHASGGTFTVPAAVEFADRILTLDELYGYSLNNELVVLSACETGVGKAIRGEGVQSVARAFQYAGAKNVLFSLWKVNDYSTAWIMERFYQEYKGGMTRSGSLQQQALAYLNNDEIDNVKKSPYYWAAFVSYGRAETPSYTSGNYFVYLGLVLLGVVGFFVYRRRKNKL